MPPRETQPPGKTAAHHCMDADRGSSGLGWSISKVCQGSEQGGQSLGEPHGEEVLPPSSLSLAAGTHSGPWPG